MFNLLQQRWLPVLHGVYSKAALQLGEHGPEVWSLQDYIANSTNIYTPAPLFVLLLPLQPQMYKKTAVTLVNARHKGVEFFQQV